MTHQIPVLYTEHKRKKAKIWLDGFLVPRPTLNSARLISAGKHEIDVVFYSSIDDIKPGREFETDKYLITVEETHNDNQPCPRPNFVVNDPTMKNRPKSAAFIPPRLVPKPEPPPPSTAIPTFERHNPNQWGFAGMTTTMKRDIDDYDHDNNLNRPSKISKSSHFHSLAQHNYKTVQSEKTEVELPVPTGHQPGLLNDAMISRLLNTKQSYKTKSSPAKQSPQVSWSTWDDSKSDEEESAPTVMSNDENTCQQPAVPIKQTFDWKTLVQSAGQQSQQSDQLTKSPEIMPKFDFDDSSFDTLFSNIDD